jgi:hypothetical protein
VIKIAFEVGSMGPIVHKQSLQNAYCYRVSIFGGSTDCDFAYVTVGYYNGEVCCVLHVSCVVWPPGEGTQYSVNRRRQFYARRARSQS